MRRRTTDQDDWSDGDASVWSPSRDMQIFDAVLAVGCLCDLLLDWGSALVLIAFEVLEAKNSNLLLAGVFALLHGVVLYGCTATLVPRAELRSVYRREVMKSQGGHSAMLAHFLGCGALTELIRHHCCLKGRTIEGLADGPCRLRRAVRLHGLVLASVQACVQLFSLISLDLETAPALLVSVLSLSLGTSVLHSCLGIVLWLGGID